MSPTAKQTWCANVKRRLLAKRNKCWDETDHNNKDCEGYQKYQLIGTACDIYGDRLYKVLTPEMKETLSCSSYPIV